MGNYPSTSCGFDPYIFPTFDVEDLPVGLKFSMMLLTDDQSRLCRRLSEIGQEHIFDGWEKLPPDTRRAFGDYLETLDKRLGGIERYIDRMQRLLDRHRAGLSRWNGWDASPPSTSLLKLGEKEFEMAERVGCMKMGNVAFVLNATELGSHVGFNDALVKLEVDLTTDTSYLEYYIQHILAIQKRYGRPNKRVPFCILTSRKTYEPIKNFLSDNEHFGMAPVQIRLLRPSTDVPCFTDYTAKIFVDPDDRTKLPSIANGDGCFHALIHETGLVNEWEKLGIKYLYFFEGANSLAFQALPYMIYASIRDELVLNYLAVPRKPGEKTDAMVKLNANMHEVMVSLEHECLDEVLKNCAFTKGDSICDEDGYSPFPASTHTMLVVLETYREVLKRTGGELPTTLMPTPSLEQDQKQFMEPVAAISRLTEISTILRPEQAAQVGITYMEAKFAYAPVRAPNKATTEMTDMPVYCSITAEVALYAFHRTILRSIGCRVEEGDEKEYNGLQLKPNPNLVFHPSFCLTVSDYRDRFQDPPQVYISKRSTMVVRGRSVLITSLHLDGCLSVDCEEGYNVKIRGKLQNGGWEIVSDDPGSTINMRGFKVNRKDKKYIYAGNSLSPCTIM